VIEILGCVGTILAISGSILSLYGAWLFNIKRDYTGSKVVWAISNPALLVWSAGYLLRLWDGSLSMLFVAGMYGYYTVTNWYGLWRK
jgi:hypothetical protein